MSNPITQFISRITQLDSLMYDLHSHIEKDYSHTRDGNIKFMHLIAKRYLNRRGKMVFPNIRTSKEAIPQTLANLTKTDIFKDELWTQIVPVRPQENGVDGHINVPESVYNQVRDIRQLTNEIQLSNVLASPTFRSDCRVAFQEQFQDFTKRLFTMTTVTVVEINILLSDIQLEVDMQIDDPEIAVREDVLETLSESSLLDKLLEAQSAQENFFCLASPPLRLVWDKSGKLVEETQTVDFAYVLEPLEQFIKQTCVDDSLRQLLKEAVQPRKAHPGLFKAVQAPTEAQHDDSTEASMSHAPNAPTRTSYPG